MNIWLIIIIGIAILLIALIAFAYFKMKKISNVSPSNNIIHLTDNNFNSAIRSGLVLVDFWAAWCTPCKMLVPTMNQIADEYKDKVKVGKLNVEEAKRVAAQYKINSIPTVILFKNGKEAKRFVGVKPKHVYTNSFALK